MMDVKQLIENVTKKAMEEEDFRQKLLAEPKTAIGGLAGFAIPDSVKVTVHESAPDDLIFVLPQKPKAAAELSDAELDQVAGGKYDTYNVNKVLIVG